MWLSKTFFFNSVFCFGSVLLFIICSYIPSVCNFFHLTSLVIIFVAINFFSQLLVSSICKCVIFVNREKGIFKSSGSCNNLDDVLIYFSCNPEVGNKKLFFSNYFVRKTHLFTTLDILRFLNHLTCCVSGFLRLCIYALQHIPEDGSFYQVLYRVNI